MSRFVLRGGFDRPPAPTVPVVGVSEKAEHDWLILMEKMWWHLMNGKFVGYHEELRSFVPLLPGVWLHSFIRDFVEKRGLRVCILKGRQVYATSTVAMMMLFIARYMPGAVSFIWNMDQASAEATLASRVSDVLRQTWPGYAQNKVACSIAAGRVRFLRVEGGDSVIYAGKTKGRGATPVMTLATEFPQVCSFDPLRAQEHINGTVSGAQFASHILEGTASHLSSGGQMNTIMREAIERQRKGYKLSRQDWVGYFYPWFCVPNRYTPDEQWDSGRKMDKIALDYFRKLEDPATEYIIGREVRTGGIKLTEGQKRFWFLKYKNEKFSSMDAMHADYPSLLSESLQAGTQAQYLMPYIHTARQEGRVLDLPVLHGYPVHVGTDIGWNDQSVAVFAQQDASGRWRILDGFAVNRQSSLQFIDAIGAYEFGEKTGCRPIIWLPHDAGKHTHTNLKMTGSEEITVYDDFCDDERFDTNKPLGQPSSKAVVFSNIREVFPQLLFNAQGCKNLFAALSDCRIMEIRAKEILKKDLEDTKGKHYHDAFGILASVIKHSGRRQESDRKTGEFVRSVMARRGGMRRTAPPIIR